MTPHEPNSQVSGILDLIPSVRIVAVRNHLPKEKLGRGRISLYVTFYKAVYFNSLTFQIITLLGFLKPSDINAMDLQAFPVIVVEKVIKALKLNSKEARLKFPRLLQIVEKYPTETLDLMAKEVSLPSPNQVFMVTSDTGVRYAVGPLV